MGVVDYQSELDKVNAKLSRVKLRVKGDRLYLRGTFPPKPGHDAPKQYEISTGYRAVLKELNLAEAFAQEVESQLIREKFLWLTYLKGAEKPAETIGEWLKRLEADRWKKQQKNENTLNTWRKTYEYYYDRLPKSEPLTVELLVEVIESGSKPGTRTRELYCLSYGVLAKFAGVDDSKIKGLAKGYKAKAIAASDLPTDRAIAEAILKVPHPGWRWMFGMQATFGLRNHELFRLDTDRIAEGIVRVTDNSKSKKTRQAWACPFEWVELFDLTNVQIPGMKFEGVANNDLGTRVTRMATHYEIGYSPYAARDAYAIRLAVKGVDVAIAARWMGHSVTVHCAHYLDALQERHSQEVFDKMFKAEDPSRSKSDQQFHHPKRTHGEYV